MATKIPKYKFKSAKDLFKKKVNEENKSMKKSISNIHLKTEIINESKIRNRIRTEQILLNYNNTPSGKIFKSSKSRDNIYNIKKPTLCSSNKNMKFESNVKEMENYIEIVKDNIYNKNKEEIKKKTEKIALLQHRIEVLTTFIRLNRIQKRKFILMTKGIEKETGRLYSTQKVYYYLSLEAE